MTQKPFVKKLPWLSLALGVFCLGTRWMLYLRAMDDRGLLLPGHPLSFVLWLVTGAALVTIFLVARKQKGPKTYEENFPASMPAAVGHVLAAAGILYSVLSREAMMPGVLGSCWKGLGLLAAPCLLAAGYFRFQGKKPFFLLHVAPCLFLVFHIVDHYQTWSSQPQIQDHFFVLLGSIALVFFAFYTASFEGDIPHRRMRLGMGWGALFLCTAGLLSAGGDLWLYLGCMAWVLTDPCTLDQIPEAAPGENTP